jgi:putative Ca2+/H+ antiporter (TMEM165/GDT1 family)
MEALLVSTLVVAVSEIGDKTQLLSLLLATRFRRPWPIIAGILVATLVNHTIAGLVGAWVRGVVPPQYLRWLIAASFFAVALWALRPDKLIGDEAQVRGRFGVFTITVVAFFLAEIGDKTQVATIMLAAQFHNLIAVVAGTTIGMLIADAPVVYFGSRVSSKIPLRAMRYVAAGLFALMGVLALFTGVLR